MRLCALEHTTPHRHTGDCDTQTCPGCLPAHADHPSLVCAWHKRRATDTLRHIPDVWADLLEATPRPSDGGGGGGSESAMPINPTAIDAREHIRVTLADWTLTIRRTWRTSQLPTPTVPVMALHVRTWLPRLLAHPAHAAAITADVLGHWDQPAPDDEDGDEPRWIPGLADHARWLDTPTARVRLQCACGDRIPLDPATLTDPTGVIMCRTCGEWGTLQWWRDCVNPDTTDPLPLSELPGHLLIHHGIDTTHKALRRLDERHQITPVVEHGKRCPDNATCPGCRRPRRFDPTATALVLTHRRTA